MRFIFTFIVFALFANAATATPRTPRSTHREQVQASALMDRVEAARGTLALRIDDADGEEAERLEAVEDQLSAAYWKLSKALDGAWGMCDDDCPAPSEFRVEVAAAKAEIEALLKAAR